MRVCIDLTQASYKLQTVFRRVVLLLTTHQLKFGAGKHRGGAGTDLRVKLKPSTTQTRVTECEL